MNIVYATDDNGALGTGVSIVSLMENFAARRSCRYLYHDRRVKRG